MRAIKPSLVVLTVLIGFFLLISYNNAVAFEAEDIAEIKREVGELKKDVAEIKKLLRAAVSKARPPEKTTSVTTVDNDPVLGSPTAPLTLVEFADYECPYSARHYRNTFSALKEEYIDTGKLRYVYRDFPLSFHKRAQKAHEAASCAGEQGKYWEMHGSIFDNQKKMEVDNLREYAETIGLDLPVFNVCLDSGKYTDEINKDIDAGKEAGVRGTPSFILGRTEDNGEVKGLFIRGAQPAAYFKKEIDQLLEQVQSSKKDDN